MIRAGENKQSSDLYNISDENGSSSTDESSDEIVQEERTFNDDGEIVKYQGYGKVCL